jgi:fibronectin type 3 domain-containing protein
LSDRFRATTQPVPLPASNLTAVDVTSSQIDLTWTDNSTNEQGYSIRRSLTNSGRYAEVATVGPNVTKYANGNLVYGTVYYYVVVATNGGAESAASNQATATTPR